MACVNSKQLVWVNKSVSGFSFQSRLHRRKESVQRAHTYKLQRVALKLVAAVEESGASNTLTLEDNTSTSSDQPISSQDKPVMFKKFRDMQKGEEVVEYLKQKYTRDSKFDVAEAMFELEKMVLPIVYKKVKHKVVQKALVAYEAMMVCVEEQLEEMSQTDVVKVLKSIGKTSNLIVMRKKPSARIVTRKKESTLPADMFHKLINRIFNNLAILDDEEILMVSISMGTFRYSNYDHYARLFKQIKFRFFDSNPRSQAMFFQSLTNIRYCTPEFLHELETQLFIRSIIFESEFQVRMCILFFVAFGFQYPTTLEILAERYVEQAKKDPYKTGQHIAIKAMANLGTPVELLQIIINNSIMRLNDEQIKKAFERAPLGWQRKIELLYINSGQKLIFPIIPVKKVPANHSFFASSNYEAFAVFAFLKVSLEGRANLQRWVVYADGYLNIELSIVSKEDEKIKICVDTRFPTSYTVSEPKKMLGGVRRLLQSVENVGWIVVVVDGPRFLKEQSYKEQILADVEEILDDGKLSREADWKL